MVVLKDISQVLENFWSEEIRSSIDHCAHKCTRLLDVMQHLTRTEYLNWGRRCVWGGGGGGGGG